jgi:hypothetical protein
MITDGTAQDREVAIAIAAEALDARRLPSGVSEAHQWAYFAEETGSWFAVTESAMVELARAIAAIPAEVERTSSRAMARARNDTVEAWAARDSTGLELDRRTGRILERIRP